MLGRGDERSWMKRHLVRRRGGICRRVEGGGLRGSERVGRGDVYILNIFQCFDGAVVINAGRKRWEAT